MKKLRIALPLFGVLLMAAACNRDTDFNYYYYEPADYTLLSQYLNLPERPHNYESVLPKHLSALGLAARPVQQNKVILGRVLFYDKTCRKTAPCLAPAAINKSWHFPTTQP
ncbi:MAG: hypothetical protein IPH12_00265 [Saprospirales bacterium]|nr:hypothetical protein [Saprospirales bacterium]